ncbi:uncharacterized protein LOC128219227 [Mya arenaria]|uniref:uncharacterized protein LOC128219227 n=1 Tax=Mya arenaria TaxID=6604 RepID=UPI0022E5A20A|nr:uncharacterized protein LOC128219227 [Mya arenaria]
MAEGQDKVDENLRILGDELARIRRDLDLHKHLGEVNATRLIPSEENNAEQLGCHGDALSKNGTESVWRPIKYNLAVLNDTILNPAGDNKAKQLGCYGDVLSENETESVWQPIKSKFKKEDLAALAKSAQILPLAINMIKPDFLERSFYDYVVGTDKSWSSLGLEDLDADEFNLFAKALVKGYEHRRRIRLMVVGIQSVGKTLLVNNLVDKIHDKEHSQSTEGIDVHICKSDTSNKWIKVDKSEMFGFAGRIRNAMFENQNNEEGNAPTAENTSQVVVKEKLRSQHDDYFMKAFIKEFGQTVLDLDNTQPPMVNPPNNNKQIVSVWDFAGQNLYYSSHHFFLNSRCIYLLLMDMTKDLDSRVEEGYSQSGLFHQDFTYLDAFRFWLNSIHMYCSTEAQNHIVQPTIILVGTHRDQMPCSEEQKEEEMEEFFERALETLIDTPVLQHVHDKKFLVNNLEPDDPVYYRIRDEVKQIAEKQPYWNEKYPTSFVQLESALDSLRVNGKEVVTLREIEKANEQSVKPVDADQLQLFLQLEHMFGNILYFNTDELKDSIVLCPQWIIDAFKCFITHKRGRTENTALRKEYREFAVIRPKLLEEIIERSPENVRAHGDVVVKYMEHLNILAKPVLLEMYEGDEKDKSTHAFEGGEFRVDSDRDRLELSYNVKMLDFYIVPCQLKSMPDTTILDELKNPHNWLTTQALCFVFKDKFMPPAVFHRLLAASIRSWEIAKYSTDAREQTLLFNGIGVFKTSPLSQLSMWYQDHIIYARMAFMSSQDDPEKAIDGYTCKTVRKTLYKTLTAILGLMRRSRSVKGVLPFEEYVQCPRVNTHNHGLFRVNDFIIEDEKTCSDHHALGEAHVITKADILGSWYKDALEDMGKLKKQDEDVELDRVPEDRELSVIARKLGTSKDIWLLGVELGIPQTTMQTLQREHSRESRDVFVYHILYEWKRRSRKPYLSVLRKTILAVFRNSQIDLVDMLKGRDVDGNHQLQGIIMAEGQDDEKERRRRLAEKLAKTGEATLLQFKDHANVNCLKRLEEKVLEQIRRYDDALSENDYTVVWKSVKSILKKAGAMFGPDMVTLLILALKNNDHRRFRVRMLYELLEDRDMLWPLEVKLVCLNDEAFDLYAKALVKGYEHRQRIRLMVVGIQSVGKTLLVHNLVDNLDASQYGKIPGAQSTDGIDVHICKSDTSNKWIQVDRSEMFIYADRIRNALFDNQNDEDGNAPARENTQAESKEKLQSQNDVSEKVDTSEISVRENLRSQQYKVLTAELLQELGKRLFDLACAENYGKTSDSPPNSKQQFVSVWDFAGQNHYYSFHHFFLNSRCIYLLLMDMTKDLNSKVEEGYSQSGLFHEDFTYLDALRFWLNSIHMYSSTEAKYHSVQPTIILIGTHKDLMACCEEQKEEKMEAVFEKALESFVDTPVLQHVHDKKFLVNDVEPEDPVYHQIRDEVQQIAEKQPYWNEKYPTSFVQLEKALDAMRANGKEVVTFCEIQKANQENVMPVDEDQLRLFLQIEHMFGNILYFNTDELKDNIVISPQWIIDAFKCFITHKHGKSDNTALRKEYRELAIIKPKLLEEIIERSPKNVRAHGDIVVKYMEHLNILAKPVLLEMYEDNEEEMSRYASEKGEFDVNLDRDKLELVTYNVKMLDCYIVPCQLKAMPDKITLNELKNPSNWFTTPALCFVFNDKFMPPAVFHRLLAASIRTWEIAKCKIGANEQTLLFNGIAVFKTSPLSQLRLWYQDHNIYAKTAFMFQDDSEEEIDAYTCQTVRRTLHKHIMAIYRLVPQARSVENPIPFEEYVQCPKLTTHKHGLFRVNDFIIEDKKICSDHHALGEAHIITKADILGNWYKDALEDMRKSKEQDEGVELDRVPEDSELSVIARRLGSSKAIWLFGVELGIPQPTMETLQRDHSRESRDVFIYHMLYEWKRRSRKPYLSVLRKTIFAVYKDSSINLVDLLKRLKRKSDD